MLDAILLPIGEGNRILGQIANGKIDELIAQTYEGDHERMKQTVNNIAIVMQSLQTEMARLTEPRKKGSSRSAASQSVPGAYGDIVGGVNTMLDAILLPIGEGNRILPRSPRQDRRTDRADLQGDHEKMKKAHNRPT